MRPFGLGSNVVRNLRVPFPSFLQPYHFPQSTPSTRRPQFSVFNPRTVQSHLLPLHHRIGHRLIYAKPNTTSSKQKLKPASTPPTSPSPLTPSLLLSLANLTPLAHLIAHNLSQTSAIPPSTPHTPSQLASPSQSAFLHLADEDDLYSGILTNTSPSPPSSSTYPAIPSQQTHLESFDANPAASASPGGTTTHSSAQSTSSSSPPPSPSIQTQSVTPESMPVPKVVYNDDGWECEPGTMKPIEPEPSLCCGNDCPNCIWIQFDEQMCDWKAAQKKLGK